MLNLNFKQGLSSNLPNVSHDPGTIYLLTDLHELYYDKEGAGKATSIIENHTFTLTRDGTSQVSFVTWDNFENAKSVRVIFDNVEYNLPIRWYIYEGDMEIETNCAFGSDIYSTNSDYPFGVMCYKGSSYAWLKSSKGSHTISITKIEEPEAVRAKITDTDLILFTVEEQMEMTVGDV